MKRIFLLLLILPLFVVAQEKGIKFEHGPTWSQIKEKAKKENKHIFVDLYTTWCGPCKYMSTQIFTQAKVGDFFNPSFISAKIQMDKTKDDSEEIKSWYAEADRFAKDYNIQAYPTFLVFDPNGELVHRMVGGGDADEFIARTKESLDPKTQYYTLIKEFEKNPKDLSLAHRMSKAANTAYDEATAAKADDIIIANTKPEDLTKECATYLIGAVRTTSSKSFELLLNNSAKIDNLLGKNGQTNRTLSSIVVNEVLGDKINFKTEPNWTELKNEVSSKYGTLNFDPIFKIIKAQYFIESKNYPAFKDVIESYLTSEDLTPNQLNSYAWNIFENCDDRPCLEAALKWSKKSLEQGDNGAYVDTYANLLYKNGDKENAIKWAEKALSLASEDEKQAYQDTLDKMKKGIKTWE